MTTQSLTEKKVLKQHLFSINH